MGVLLSGLKNSNDTIAKAREKMDTLMKHPAAPPFPACDRCDTCDRNFRSLSQNVSIGDDGLSFPLWVYPFDRSFQQFFISEPDGRYTHKEQRDYRQDNPYAKHNPCV